MKKHILLTGSPRSGTTWIGRIISAGQSVRYIPEPFTPNRKNTPIKNWFEFCSEAGDPERNREILSYLITTLKEKPNFKLILRRLLDARTGTEIVSQFTYLRNQYFWDRILIKDPIAVLSAEWISANLDADVIVSIRHPAAFAASIKVKNWGFDCHNYYNQDLLMNSLLKDYKDEIQAYAQNPPDVLRQAILLWKTIYSTVIHYREKFRDDWIFVKHEDISIDPVNQFMMIFDKLDIGFTNHVKKRIMESTTAKKETEFKRNARDNIRSWQQRLTASEIDLIKKETFDIWTKFYTEDDWN